MKSQASIPNSAERFDRFVSAFAYFTILPAIVLLFIPHSGKRSAVRFHACQSIFLNAILMIAFVSLDMVASFQQFLQPDGAAAASLAQLLLPASIAGMLACVAYATRVAMGKAFRIPLLSALAEREANGAFFRLLDASRSHDHETLFNATR
jgi:uncharacterized membrane protein